MSYCRYALDMSEEVAMQQLTEYIPAIEGWAYNFMHPVPQPGLGDIEFARYMSFIEVVVVCV